MYKKLLKYQTAWRRMGDAIIKPGGEYAHTITMNPHVVEKDNDIYLFYAGDAPDGKRTIRLVIFRDGDFTKPEYQGIMINNGEWGSFDGKWCVLPNIVKVKDKWHMYYSGNKGSGAGLSAFPGLGLAISDDLLHWEKYSNIPLIAPSGEPGTPDAVGIAGGGLVTLPDGTLRWYYTGCPTIGDEHFLNQQKNVCVAESKDGFVWEKKGAVISRDPERDYKDVASACGPCYIEDGLFKLWYPCIGTRWGYYSICYGESEDGINWNVGERYGDEMAFGPRNRHRDMTEKAYTWDSQMVSYPAVFEKDGQKYMFYCGNGYGEGGIGIAMACNIRVYARDTELFATYQGEVHDVNIHVTVNGVEIPKTHWSTPDSDCNIWREATVNGITVRLIVTHVLNGIKLFCTAISGGETAIVQVTASIGQIATEQCQVSVEKFESKATTVEVILK